MKKAKRIGALILVILLIGLSLSALISAFFATPESAAFFNASLFSMAAVPIFLFACILVYRLLKDKNKEFNENEENL